MLNWLILALARRGTAWPRRMMRQVLTGSLLFCLSCSSLWDPLLIYRCPNGEACGPGTGDSGTAGTVDMLASLTEVGPSPSATAVAGQALTNVALGSFQDSITPALTKEAYMASVDWGDGTSTTEAVVDNGTPGLGQFKVLGSTHTYTGSKSPLNVKVTISTTSAGITRTLILYCLVTVLPFPCSVSASFTSDAGDLALSLNIGAAGSLTGFLTVTQGMSGFISRFPGAGGGGITSMDCSTTPWTVVIGGTMSSVSGTAFMPGQPYTLTLSQVNASGVMTAQLTANGLISDATRASSGASLRITKLTM